mmetsp:Transcript_4857/g.13109  ORF Transcript_4857/g.13109 Transcript_4857/m.13109 type:complete len:240 (+) Transcript_4857:114-833(+)
MSLRVLAQRNTAISTCTHRQAQTQREMSAYLIFWLLLAGCACGLPVSLSVADLCVWCRRRRNTHKQIGTAQAAEKRLVGEIAGSGLIFKDTLNVEAWSDPKVEGVTIYIADFARPITERFQKDFFSDPTSVSLTCAQSGPVKISPSASRSKDGEEVISEARSLLFKSIKVRRLIDEKSNNIIYVAYSTRFGDDDSNKSRFKSSICALSVNAQQPVAPSPQSVASSAPADPKSGQPKGDS